MYVPLAPAAVVGAAMSPTVYAESAVAAKPVAKRQSGVGGFFGRLFDEVSDVATDVAGSVGRAAGSVADVYAQSWVADAVKKTGLAPTTYSPSGGKAPAQESAANKSGGGNALPLAVFVGGGALLGAAVLLRK